MISKHKKKIFYWLLAIITIAIMITIIINLDPTTSFARMGSSGGGGGGGGGVSASGGGGSSSSRSSHSSKTDDLAYMIVTLLFWLCLLIPNGRKLVAVVEQTFTIGIKNYFIIPKWLREDNPRLADVKLKIKELWLFSAKPPENLTTQFINIYGNAQFAYGDTIRNGFMKSGIDLKLLKQYLSPVYLNTMHSEIISKINNNTFDDVVVNRGRILNSWQLDDDIWLVKLNAFGYDKEIAINANFTDTWEQEQWVDLVLFVRDRAGKWKISNIVYGNHFHLNNKDYDQATDVTGYQKQHPDSKYKYLVNDYTWRHNVQTYNTRDFFYDLLMILLITSLGIILLLAFSNFLKWINEKTLEYIAVIVSMGISHYSLYLINKRP